jgi:hypothetical protein
VSFFVGLSSFESELDSATGGMKTLRKLMNILEEMQVEYSEQPVLYSDNEAMINFVKGEGVAKGVRHMELRMWYTREQYKSGRIVMKHMSGKVISSDKFTKLANRRDHEIFRNDVQGLGLLS